MRNIFQVIGMITLLTLFAACNGGKMEQNANTFPQMKDVSPELWNKLAQKRIYFGHQSVGFNIVDGIKDVMKEHPEVKLNIVESADASDLKAGTFEHSRVGKNVDPKSKVEEFTKFVEQGIGKNADFSALKFCYVDVRADTNVKSVLKDYESFMSKVGNEFPKMTVVHFTVPLTRSKTTWKTIVKKLIGRKTWEYDDNIKRNEYNNMLLKKYEGREPVFDLAKIESTYPDGRRSTFTKDGKTYYSLVPEYTNDGGHLNELGRKIVAEQLLIFLANLSK